VQKTGARIMGLDDPSAKMSKSAASAYNYIALTDTPDVIRKKCLKAVTDTEGGVTYDPERKPAVSNLMAIYHHATGKTMKEIEAEYAGKGYGDFKKGVAEAVIAMLAPVQAKIDEYRKDPAELGRILDAGRDVALAMAHKKMQQVRERMGVGR
jgi:tryptophanyl-tRNA synthetase